MESVEVSYHCLLHPLPREESRGGGSSVSGLIGASHHSTPKLSGEVTADKLAGPKIRSGLYANRKGENPV
ncbi:hypothetical protein E2C01_066083 [Portunus trituberculatus]|uniref:Uncharacterized protein n=1 Tax=Portunus trituberculatus TaxID=210409 RepID=A0A5B7HNU4_PORTR|nr:hypothetical protein [Portunus trituberculatus]